MKVCIIIPTYNEGENIIHLVKEIDSVLKKGKISGKIFVVDDDSPDKTWQIAQSLGKKYNVEVIRRKENRGYGNSVIEGLKRAIKDKFEIAITMDADFSHNPEAIPYLVSSISGGADVAIGSRRVSGGKIVNWSAWRHFSSMGATTISKLLLGMKTKDITSGYRAYKIKVLKDIPLGKIHSNGYSFLEEFLYSIEKRKYIIKEVPITFVDRKKGISKLSKKEIVKFFITLIKLRLGI